MPTTMSPLKRAITAAKCALGPQRYGLEDRVFVCQMCGHDHFKTGQYIAAVGMHTLVCAECRYVIFFEKMPERIAHDIMRSSKLGLPVSVAIVAPSERVPELGSLGPMSMLESFLGLMIVSGFMLLTCALPLGVVLCLQNHYKFHSDWSWAIWLGAIMAGSSGIVGGVLLGVGEFVVRRRHVRGERRMHNHAAS